MPFVLGAICVVVARAKPVDRPFDHDQAASSTPTWRCCARSVRHEHRAVPSQGTARSDGASPPSVQERVAAAEARVTSQVRSAADAIKDAAKEAKEELKEVPATIASRYRASALRGAMMESPSSQTPVDHLRGHRRLRQSAPRPCERAARCGAAPRGARGLVAVASAAHGRPRCRGRVAQARAADRPAQPARPGSRRARRRCLACARQAVALAAQARSLRRPPAAARQPRDAAHADRVLAAGARAAGRGKRAPAPFGEALDRTAAGATSGRCNAPARLPPCPRHPDCPDPFTSYLPTAPCRSASRGIDRSPSVGSLKNAPRRVFFAVRPATRCCRIFPMATLRTPILRSTLPAPVLQAATRDSDALAWPRD